MVNGVGVISVKTVLVTYFGLWALSFVIPTFCKFIVCPSPVEKAVQKEPSLLGPS